MMTEVLDLGLNLLSGLFEEKKPTRLEDVLPKKNPCNWMFDEDTTPSKKKERKLQKKEDSSIHLDVRDSHNVWINININN